MDLAVTTREHSGWTVVAVDGDVDFGTARRLSEALSAAGAAYPWLVLDCALLVFSDSSFLNAVLTSYNQTQTDGGMLVIAAVPARLERKLGMTGLDQVISVYPSVAAAVA